MSTKNPAALPPISPLDHAVADMENAVMELEGYYHTFALLVEMLGTNDRLPPDVSGYLMIQAGEMTAKFRGIHDRLWKATGGQGVAA